MKHQADLEALERYRDLLRRYHGTLDLLSDRGLEDVERLVAEAERYAAVVERLGRPQGTLLDVGSGAGLPGVVLALRLPGWRVILSERKRRRAGFLMLAAGRLGLANAEVFEGDVRRLSGVRADVIVAQGVGSFTEVYTMTRSVHAGEVVLISRKGPDWRLEADALGAASGAAVAVVGQESLEHRGTLVALRLAGGHACRSSG